MFSKNSSKPLIPVSKINVVHLTHSLSRLGGGLFQCVQDLAREVHLDQRVQLTVMGLEDDSTMGDIGSWSPLDARAFPVVGPRKLGCSPSLDRALTAHAPDLVHLHGLWKYTSVAARRWARATSRPYLVSPHGMLEPWSLAQSRLPKWVANQIYQRSCLRAAACLSATSRMEAENIRLAGFRNPIALIPNGVEIPAKPLPQAQREPGRPRRALFLSRIHPKKGLLNLVEAWNALQPIGWELVIVGPDENGHLAEVMTAVAERGLEKQILFLGEVWGAEKNKLYCESDLFVLPTFSENFGLVVAEALSCEVPVITTRAAPWHELEDFQCGWWIDVGVEPLICALRQALALPQDALRNMGVRGRRLIENKYTWEPVGKLMLATYDWILGHGPKPDHIID
jgi:glycosyltransferase involved in cell wall biosynthesis